MRLYTWLSHPARRWPVRVTVAVVLMAVLVWLLSVRASTVMTGLIRDFASAQVAAASDSVYRLEVGRIHVSWARRRVAIDELALGTDEIRNQARRRPLGRLMIAASGCTIGRVSLLRLVTGRGLAAGYLGCREVTLTSDQPPDRAAPAPAGPDSVARSLTIQARQRRLELPALVPSVRIDRVTFPAVAISLIQRQADGGHLKFTLARAHLTMEDMVVDPQSESRSARPLFSRSVVVSAESTTLHLDSMNVLHFGQVHMSLTDSTILVQDFRVEPGAPDQAAARPAPYRRDRVRLNVARVAASGADVRAFVRYGAIVARSVVVDSARLRVSSDQRLPNGAVQRRRRSPQSFLASLDRTVALDTVWVHNSTIIYDEMQPLQDAPGHATFSHVEALGTPVRHQTEGATPPMRLSVSALFMNRGRLEARFEVPLDAATFNMQVSGSLGAMPAAALNPLVEHVSQARLKSGDVSGVTFAFTVTSGAARGHITPQYHGLAVDITGRGTRGALSSGSALRGALRGLAEFAANRFMVRGDNPDHDGGTPRVGDIERDFHGESLPSFLWLAVRDGLLPVLRH